MDDGTKILPRYGIGELVSCAYDFYQYYVSPFMKEDEQPAFTGIIIEIDYALFSEVFGYEVVYLVLCLDGRSRYFAEDEIVRIG